MCLPSPITPEKPTPVWTAHGQWAGCRYPAFQASVLCGAAFGEGVVSLEDMTSHLHQAGEPVPIPHVSERGQNMVYKVTQVDNNQAEN